MGSKGVRGRTGMGPKDRVGSKERGWGVKGEPKSSAETMARREKDIFRASGWEGGLVSWWVASHSHTSLAIRGQV